MSELPGDEDYDEEDTTQRGATAFAGTGAGIPTGSVGAGGGPTIRAVTLGALSVPVPRHVEIRALGTAKPQGFPWAAVLLGIVLGVCTTLVVGAFVLHALGVIHLF